MLCHMGGVVDEVRGLQLECIVICMGTNATQQQDKEPCLDVITIFTKLIVNLVYDLF